MYEELLSIELKKSPMWEINNPRVNVLTRDLLAFVFESSSFNKEQMEDVFYILLSLIRIYGDPRFGQERIKEINEWTRKGYGSNFIKGVTNKKNREWSPIV